MQQIAWKTLLWFIVAAVFVGVLFADFLPQPLGGYASQRFVLVGLLAVVVSAAGAVLVSRNG